MKIPLITLVGRVNVGKSALFNGILGKNKALVVDVPGSTRDRNIQMVDGYFQPFLLCDTGGLIFLNQSGKAADTDSGLQEQIHQQVEFAMDLSDAIFFVVDRKTGLTGEDREVFAKLRPHLEKVWVVVNKVDDDQHDPDMFDFFQLGVDKVFPVSALHKRGLQDLVEDCLLGLGFKPQPVVRPLESWEEEPVVDSKPDFLKIAVIGKPNAGKSTLINQWIGEDRLVVSSVPGTTRDPIDSEIRFHGQPILLIDTAGLKKKSKWEGIIDHFTGLGTHRSIARADICVLVFDAAGGFTEQDAKIATLALESGKSLILAGNKWDLYPDKDSTSVEKYREEFFSMRPYLDFCPLELFSATTKLRVYKLLELTVEKAKLRSKRISSAELNQVLTYVREKLAIAVDSTRALRVKYGTQIRTNPPLFLFYVNHPESVPPSFERYMIKQLRRFFPFEATPLKIFWRQK